MKKRTKRAKQETGRTPDAPAPGAEDDALGQGRTETGHSSDLNVGDTALITDAVASLFAQAGGSVEEASAGPTLEEQESQDEKFAAEEGYGDDVAEADWQAGGRETADGIELVEFEKTRGSEPGAGPTFADAPEQEAEERDLADQKSASRRATARIEDITLEPANEDEEPETLPSEIEDETASVEDMPETPEFQTPSEIKSALECLLFTTTHPLNLPRLRTILGRIDMRTLRGAVAQLQAEYDARDSGLQIVENADGFQMCTRPRYANAILRLHRQRKRNPLTVTALETLAIVAYKQPVTRAEIEMIRGVESSGVLRNLLDMGLLRVVGRKEVIGRPQLYGTTNVFLNTFGLKAIQDLPPIHELRGRYSDTSLFASVAPPEVAESSEEPGSVPTPDDSPDE